MNNLQIKGEKNVEHALFFVICTSISIQFNVIHKFIDGKDTTIFQYYQTDNNLFQATKSSFLCEKIIFDKKNVSFCFLERNGGNWNNHSKMKEICKRRLKFKQF